MHRIFTTPFASVYPLYVTKAERKGRTREEVDTIVRWLTGFDDVTFANHLRDGTTFEAFFAAATLPAASEHITGVVCGVRVENVEDPLMKKIRMLDKLVDELAKGRSMERILRRDGGSPRSTRRARAATDVPDAS